jgi:hypothetical protein
MSWFVCALGVFLFSACGSSEITAGPAAEADPPVDESLDSETEYTPPGTGLEVDPSTLHNKMVMGYQGWFSAPGDGSVRSSFRHWFSADSPDPVHVTFDAWPDLSEWSEDELFETNLHMADGTPARVYSAFNAATVDRHFSWMEEHRIDGVFLQQFVVELEPGSNDRAFRDRVTDNVRAGAEAHGRVFSVMYDLTGASNEVVYERIVEHWESMVTAGIVGSEQYLHHRGRPLVALWGLGFSERDLAPEIAANLLIYFRDESSTPATILGGVPTYWRTRTEDASTDSAWTDVIENLDVISPWTVGRFADDAGVENYRHRLEADMARARIVGAEVLPVVWPGFSWANLYKGQAMNQIPRRGGRFLWKQIYEYVDAGATMLYGSMFDEVDEATAFFKVVTTEEETPIDAHFLTLDVDGEHLESDFYLQLAGAARDTLVGAIPLSEFRPIGPMSSPVCHPPESELYTDRCVPSCDFAGGDSCDVGECEGHFRFTSYDCPVCCDTSF